MYIFTKSFLILLLILLVILLLKSVNHHIYIISILLVFLLELLSNHTRLWTVTSMRKYREVSVETLPSPLHFLTVEMEYFENIIVGNLLLRYKNRFEIQCVEFIAILAIRVMNFSVDFKSEGGIELN